MTFFSQEPKKIRVTSVLEQLEIKGFPLGDTHRLSIFNANAKFYVLMGTIADIRSADRSVDCENFLEQVTGEWVMKLLVRDPVKLLQPPVELSPPKAIEVIEEPEEILVEGDLRRTKER